MDKVTGKIEYAIRFEEDSELPVIDIDQKIDKEEKFIIYSMCAGLLLDLFKITEDKIKKIEEEGDDNKVELIEYLMESKKLTKDSFNFINSIRTTMGKILVDLENFNTSEINKLLNNDIDGEEDNN